MERIAVQLSLRWGSLVLAGGLGADVGEQLHACGEWNEMFPMSVGRSMRVFDVRLTLSSFSYQGDDEVDVNLG